MTIELYLLTASVMLGLVHIVLASHSASFQRGYWWTATSRDEPVPPLVGIAGRFERAAKNFLETFPFFAAAVLVAHMTNTHSALTVWGAHLYIWSRLLYLFLYATGVPLARSLVWNVATLGILLILFAPIL